MSEEERETSLLKSPLLDAGAGALDLAGGSGVFGIMLNGLRYGRERFWECAHAEILENAETGTGRKPTPEEFSARAQQVEPIRMKTADPKKLELLRRAVVNSFDPELAEAGYTAHLLRLLDELEYPDIATLRAFGRFLHIRQKLWDAVPGSDGYVSLRLMARLGLVRVAPEVERADLMRRVMRLSGPDVTPITNHQDALFVMTSLGERMLCLLQEPLIEEPKATD